MINHAHRHASLMALLLCLTAPQTIAQWTNHYPKLDDFGHHVYLEQHELPILSHGPVDPAPAPDGRTLAFAAQGWIWRLDLDTGEASRLTRGPGVDSRPRWSPDGDRLAFVRDTGTDTRIVLLDLDSGEQEIINTPAIDLDPEFSADGKHIYYTSGASGSLELLRHDLTATTDETLTDLDQVVRNTRRLPGGSGLLYLHGEGAHRVLRERDFVTGHDRIAHAETLTYLLSADVHPTRRLIVYSAPIDNDYHLWTMDLDDPRVKHRLTQGSLYATSPAFSADGEHIYFVDLDGHRQFRLMRLPTYGGTAQQVTIRSWDYGVPTGTLSLSLTDGDGNPVTARVSISDSEGHPVAFPGDATYTDPQTGRYYFYVERDSEFTLPAGRYKVLAARGPMSELAATEVDIRGGEQVSAELAIQELWNARAAGYVSADHHVHLNGDGHHRSGHEHALRLLAGESLDQLAPMSWNRWERRIDSLILGQETSRDAHTVQQGQEVRSHFHGHVGLLNVQTPFTPWFFGPANPTLGDPDRSNGEVFDFADEQGAFATYVHPARDDRDPFTHLEDAPLPLELVSDGVLARRMGLELVCAWTSPLGNAEIWYRLLNIGRAVAAMSGTDGWVDFHRTPAMGTARTYIRTLGPDSSPAAVIEAAAAGRSFVTTGPALLFAMDDGAQPGDTTAPGRRGWQAVLTATNDVDVVEIIINGAVVERLEGIAAGAERTYRGDVELPAGGWIAARAYASEKQDDAWPTMHARPFAHSSPIWIGSIGSTEPGARAAAAADLSRAIDAAEVRAQTAYDAVETKKLQARFDAARRQLADMVEAPL